MIETRQLPHLVTLLDDPSPRVRKGVLAALADFEDSLEPSLRELEPGLDEEELQGVLAVVELYRRDHREVLLFGVGQIVRHKRFGYRALIVACDPAAENAMPGADPVTYHLLVHGSDGVTHAGPGSLEQDDSRQGVRHPLVERYFRGAHGGRYLRNDVPWGR